MYCAISPYLRRRLSRNSSRDNSMPLKPGGTALSHTPLLFVLWWRFLYWPPASSFCLASSPNLTCIFSLIATKIALRMHALCLKKFREEPPKRKSTISPLADLEVLYVLYADNQGSGIPKPVCLTLWPRIFRKLALISSPPNSAGNIFSLRASSIGDPLESQLRGQSFVGTATRVAKSSIRWHKRTGGVIGLLS